MTSEKVLRTSLIEVKSSTSDGALRLSVLNFCRHSVKCEIRNSPENAGDEKMEVYGY